jgi:putative phosphoesterase
LPPARAGRTARSGASGTAGLRVVVLADTHLRSGLPGSRGGIGRLPGSIWAHLRGADFILHGGDVLDDGILSELGQFAPVHAVLGNNDRALVGILPLTALVELGGVRIGMIHDSGAAHGRARRLHRRFPDADVVVFGHSHAPVNEQGEGGQLLFNPGSPTQRRAQPVHSIGELRVADGAVVEHRIIALDAPSPRSASSTTGPAPGAVVSREVSDGIYR